MVFDQGYVDRELAVALHELPGTIEGVHEPEAVPTKSVFEHGFRRFFGEDRGISVDFAEAGDDDIVGAPIGFRQRRLVGLGINVEVATVDIQNGIAGSVANGQYLPQNFGYIHNNGDTCRAVVTHGKFMRLDWSQIDTVLLDMDGTLLDLSFDTYFWRQLVPEQYADMRGLSRKDAAEIVEGHYERVYGTLDWYCVDYWSRTLELDIRALKSRVSDRVGYLPESVRFLETMAVYGKRIVLVTNAHQAALAIKLSRTDLADRVDRIFSSHEFQRPKEHAEFWGCLREAEPFDCERTLLVDDSLPVLSAARGFGMSQVVAIRRPDTSAPKRIVEGFPAVDSVADLLPA